ncbi:NUDIX domain-containing protein [Streptomyces yangpuensis]|uniref:NUDIX hydrolase n=1 Tax=Streptomyces yangpuensis TaxID=1648182 RepID=UPI00365E0B3C
MTAPRRHTLLLDVHLLLRRDGGRGPEVLLSRRAGPVYATGMWHLPSGHLEADEDFVGAVVREAREETGVVIDPADVRAAVTVHHRPPMGSSSRIGVFFEVRSWSGAPRIMEPDRCDGMGWYGLDALPAPMVAYCRAGLDAYRAGLPAAVHFQRPGDPVEHRDGEPGPGRTEFLAGPATGERGGACPA